MQRDILLTVMPPPGHSATWQQGLMPDSGCWVPSIRRNQAATYAWRSTLRTGNPLVE